MKGEKDRLEDSRKKAQQKFSNTENQLKSKTNEMEQIRKQQKKLQADVNSKKNAEKDLI